MDDQNQTQQSDPNATGSSWPSDEQKAALEPKTEEQKATGAAPYIPEPSDEEGDPVKRRFTEDMMLEMYDMLKQLTGDPAAQADALANLRVAINKTTRPEANDIANSNLSPNEKIAAHLAMNSTAS